MTPIIVESEGPARLNYGELMKEVFAQGFDDFEGDTEAEARIKRWLNIAYQEILLFKDWPFLEAEYEGQLPHEFENLGKILDVVSVNSRYNLRPADRRELIRFDPVLEGTGNIAERWYREREQTINVYPSSPSETFRVRYTFIPEELREPTDVPIIPPRFIYLIVDLAIMRAYRTRDAYTAADAVEQRYNKGLEEMVKALMVPNHDMNRRILRTGGWRSFYS